MVTNVHENCMEDGLGKLPLKDIPYRVLKEGRTSI